MSYGVPGFAQSASQPMVFNIAPPAAQLAQQSPTSGDRIGSVPSSDKNRLEAPTSVVQRNHAEKNQTTTAWLTIASVIGGLALLAAYLGRRPRPPAFEAAAIAPHPRWDPSDGHPPTARNADPFRYEPPPAHYMPYRADEYVHPAWLQPEEGIHEAESVDEAPRDVNQAAHERFADQRNARGAARAQRPPQYAPVARPDAHRVVIEELPQPAHVPEVYRPAAAVPRAAEARRPPFEPEPEPDFAAAAARVRELLGDYNIGQAQVPLHGLNDILMNRYVPQAQAVPNRDMTPEARQAYWRREAEMDVHSQANINLMNLEYTKLKAAVAPNEDLRNINYAELENEVNGSIVEFLEQHPDANLGERMHMDKICTALNYIRGRGEDGINAVDYDFNAGHALYLVWKGIQGKADPAERAKGMENLITGLHNSYGRCNTGHSGEVVEAWRLAYTADPTEGMELTFEAARDKMLEISKETLPQVLRAGGDEEAEKLAFKAALEAELREHPNISSDQKQKFLDDFVFEYWPGFKAQYGRVNQANA